MSMINSSVQHDEIVNIITNDIQGTGIDGVTTCWMGAFGFFLPDDNQTVRWTWDAQRNLPWDATLAAQYMVIPGFRIDLLALQGLVLRQARNGGWSWTYSNALFTDGAVGRQCVVCLDLNPS